MAGLPAMDATGASDGLGARLLLLARRAPGSAAILLMALVGLGISIYLTVVHYQGSAVAFCPSTGIVNCNKVTSSGNSVLFGTSIPITIPGMLWFVVSGGMALVALMALWRNRLEPPRLRLAQVLWGAVGMVFVLYLVYAEIVLLHSLCEWCTVIHVLTFATFLIALGRWQQRDLPAPALAVAPVRSAVRRGASVSVPANGSPARKPKIPTTASANSTATRRPGNGASGGRSGRRPRR